MKRPDTKFLLKVHAGEFEYEVLLEMAEPKIQAIEQACFVSDLSLEIDVPRLEEVLVAFREEIYGGKYAS